MDRVPTTLANRIKVSETGCWEWQAGLNGWGYGHVKYAGKGQLVHRLIYELLVGPIADGLHVDHLCRVKHCCNPAHLEPVSPRTNILRGVGPTAINARRTHCVNGHPLEGENLYVQPTGERKCRACRRRNWANYRRKKQAERAATR